VPEKFGERLKQKIMMADVAVLDPPRAGCKRELLEAVAELAIKKLIYVSCDAATLARDVKILTERGFEFVKGVPVDMFPGSGHVESVVLMSRGGAKQ
jgi:23S rRNA (uracil1939-C5)-methyltransferase